MSHTLHSILFGAVVSAFVTGSPALVQGQTFLPDGLVAYYRFDGDAQDYAGTNHGTIVGSDWKYSVDRFGRQQGSLFLNASVQQPTVDLNGSFVEVPKAPSLDFNRDFSLSLWVNLAAAEYAQTLISNGPGGACINLRFSPKSPSWGNADILEFVWGGSSSGWYVISSPDAQAWSQIVVVRSGTNLMVYKNGLVPSPKPSSTPLPWPVMATLNGPNIRIGSEVLVGTATFTQPVVGEIDDVRIYNRALSSSEVKQLYIYESQSCTPHAATATTTLVNGFVVAATVTDGGCGYTNTPGVVIQGGGGNGAKATAVVSNGIVTEVIITDAGSGYTTPPKVWFYSPFGVQLDLVKSVRPAFSGLIVGVDYQLQVSRDMVTWAKHNFPFSATNSSMIYPDYFDVENWGELFFRLQVNP